MGKEGESVLRIINGRLGFLIAVIFVVLPLLKVYGCFSSYGYKLGKREMTGV